ncbi:NAD(P)/FAD-dependent oxidoreductase [Enterococcus hermanniensis]|uniref:Pyridine nucleotide-disulfide family oxidoreductase n=1 Tax=Enterococcus hermanniensis TaxID=249189 RepID=A0A1L8TQM1_9ENTE|nr:NAD(P)/FAD-dependent oxidoreductase [Enterococcus hermanniensis]OJG46523.1 pyridine nucleotide-disulfide family oxidoreductase [Enterococcus hermanniensis]
MKEIVILGAGYAGLRALHVLQKSSADIHITLVDRNDYHYEATSLHEVAAGTQPDEKICYKIKDVINSNKTVFVQDTVEKIDADKKEVYLENQKLNYDYLIVGLGFQSESFGIPGVKENALEMVDVKTADQVHKHIVEQMKKYKETKDEEYLRIVVCGAGFTGIELVGAFVEGSKKFADIAGVKPEDIQIYCVEAVDKILPMFSDKLGQYCLKYLKKWDVKLLTGKPIKKVEPGAVIYQNSKDNENDLVALKAKTIVWTTGVSGSKVIGDSGFEERRGRVMVKPNLTDPNHDDVYLLGDVSAVMDPSSNRPYPTTAQIALTMGSYAAKDILNQLKGQPSDPFSFKSLGSVASIGNTHAFGVVGKTEVTAYPASFIKKAIMDRSLFETGGVKEVLAKGRFDFYH